MWCLTVPLALVGEMGFGIVPVMSLMAWGLFGIQEIGLMIEEPFRRTLRLDIFTRTIYADVQVSFMFSFESCSQRQVFRSFWLTRPFPGLLSGDDLPP